MVRRSDAGSTAIATRTEFRCRICGSCDAGEHYQVQEMMLGLREIFRYAQCAACGTLWLIDPPEYLARYYEDAYYSFAESEGVREFVAGYVRAERDKTYFAKGSLLGRFARRMYDDGSLLAVSRVKVPRDARILDVGCGRGKLLRRMAALRFSHLTGIDPFLRGRFRDDPGLRIRKCALADLAGEEFDLVMFHHSLEHVPDPAAALRSAAMLLAPGGKCLVRLPVVSYAWEKYGTNWVQLDPPRHMWVPTERAMRILAESAGFRTEAVEYDSTGFQFWGSELYVRGVELRLASSWMLVREFGIRRLRQFREQTRLLNLASRGDQGSFLLGWAK